MRAIGASWNTCVEWMRKETAQTLLNSIYSLIDKGSKKNIYHKNTAARKKSQLAAQLKAA